MLLERSERSKGVAAEVVAGRKFRAKKKGPDYPAAPDILHGSFAGARASYSSSIINIGVYSDLEIVRRGAA